MSEIYSASLSASYLNGDIIISMGDDHIDGLRLGLVQLLHVLHRRAHGVLHDLEYHVVQVRGDVVEGPTVKSPRCAYRSFLAKNTFTVGATP